MRTWWITACAELVKYSRMRWVLVVLLVLPLVLIVLLGGAFDTDAKPVKVALYVADQGELGTAASEYWNSPDIKRYVTIVETVSEREVIDSVQEGAVDYGVVVPADFTARAQTGQETNWLAYPGRYANKNIAAKTIAEGYLNEFNVHSAAAAVLGPEEAGLRAARPSEDGQPLAIAGNLGTGDSDPFQSFSAVQYFAVAYLNMFLLYSSMAAALSLINQKREGTLARVYSLPTSLRAVVLGIVTGGLLLGMLQAAVIIGFTSVVYGVHWGSHFGYMAIVCFLTAAAGSGMAMILASFARNAKTLQSLFVLAAFVMTFLSGGMIPDIDKLVGDAGKYTINYWANDSLRMLMNGNTDQIGMNIGILGAIAAVLLIIAAVCMPRVVKYDA
ncbi:ABC transporter permease [Paenibacillus sp. NPDC058071]|uniref:ABC transporter permease n=1 Tax=Paenibacillus sp. NPDC058071 TaxID=3346326 RepID=UPI0036DF097D